jgi:MFS family permease
MVSMGIGGFAYTPLLPTMQEKFALSNTAGILASTNYLGSLIGAVVAAFVTAGRVRSVLLLATLWTVVATTVLVGLTANFSAWFALRFVAGLAGAGVLVFSSAVVLEGHSWRDRLGLSGLLYASPGIGNTLSGLVMLPPPCLAARWGG